MTETFGPEYVRPQNKPCPSCDCCTAPLCERGRGSVLRCAGHVGPSELRGHVEGCPCSAASTPGTLAWRAAMVRATTFATQRPMDAEAEALLILISEGAVDVDDMVRAVFAEDDADEPDEEVKRLRLLKLRGYMQRGECGAPALTDFGRAYLRARSGHRQTTAVTIQSIDQKGRTAVVEIPAFAVDQPVTVLLDQLCNSRTGLDPKAAVGALLYAEVNTDALRAEHVVLTRVQDPSTVAPACTEGAR